MAQRGWWGGKVIITLPTDNERRQKQWCEYYDRETKQCYKRLTKCCGSSQCEYYEKKAGAGPIERKYVPADVPVVKIEHPIVEKPEQKEPAKPITLADSVPGHTPPFGEKLLNKVVMIKKVNHIDIGVVVAEDHDYITIERDDGKIIKFDRKITIRQKTLWVLDDMPED